MKVLILQVSHSRSIIGEVDFDDTKSGKALIEIRMKFLDGAL